MSRRKILATWAVITALTVILVLIFGACGKRARQITQLSLAPSTTEQPADGQDSGDDSVLPPVMALDGCIAVSRGVSEDETITSQGWEAYRDGQTGTNGTSGLNVETDGTALTLRAYTAGEYAYAVYGQAIGADPKPLKTLIDSETCSYGGEQDEDIPLSYFVGIADYSIGSWRWFGPFGEVDVMITVNSEVLKSRFKSPSDNYYLCVLASNGSKAASALPDDGLIADFPIDPSARAVSAEGDLPGGLTIEEICTWVAENLYTDPAIVTGLEADVDTEGVHLTWDKNADTEVYIYQVLRDDLDDEEPAELLHGVVAPEVTYSDTTGTPGKEYQYLVRARNDAGFGGSSFVDAIRSMEAPVVTVSPETSTDYVEVTWTSVEGAVGYSIKRSDTPDGTPVELDQVDAETLTYHDYTTGLGECYYWVQALGEDEDGVLGGPAGAWSPKVVTVVPSSGLLRGRAVTFVADLTGSPPATYQWDFGGAGTPNTSDEESPAITLNDPGEYEASLTVENACGLDTFDCTLTVYGPGPGDWWMFGREPKHNARSPYVGAQTDNIKWSYQTGDSVRSSPAISVEGTVYVGSHDDYLYAIRPDGMLKWRYKTGDLVRSSPAIGSDGTIYVGSNDGYLYAIEDDETEGKVKWRYYLNGTVISSPSIGADETVYLGGWDCYLYAIRDDETEGTLKWRYETTGTIMGSPTIATDGTVYVGSYEYLYAITDDETEGTLKWRFETETGWYVRECPAIGADGTAYVGCDNNYLYAITDNGTEGTLKWRYETDSLIWCSPAIGADGTVYVGSYDNYLYAISDNETEGTLKWRYGTSGYVHSSPAIGADGTIYVGSGDVLGDGSSIYAIRDDGTEGTLKWSYETGSSCVFSSPAIGADGTVYVGSDDGYLYAFGD